jgi:hypothetical protein
VNSVGRCPQDATSSNTESLLTNPKIAPESKKHSLGEEEKEKKIIIKIKIKIKLLPLLNPSLQPNQATT